MSGGPSGISLRVLQVAAVDRGGGAAAVAERLKHGYESHGCTCWLAVGQKAEHDPHTVEIPPGGGSLARASGYEALQQALRNKATRFPGRGWGRLSRALRFATHPAALAAWYRGREDFEFPGTANLLALVSEPPDILHCHNLHGGYFDLRQLASLSQRVPVVLTLHDSWLLTGHCAHSFECERWKTGCGACPDLTIEPAVRRDATAENWQLKRDVYARSRLHVASPSRWLLDRAMQSMLAPAIQEARVIPNGIDVSVFQPASKAEARAVLGLPADAFVVLLVGSGQGSAWRDTSLLDEVLRALPGRLSENTRVDLRVVAVGHPGTAPDSAATPRGLVRREGYQQTPEAMARYYQAADVYLHLAKADTFPTTVLESLACGTPVVATAVGGIKEQICNWDSGFFLSHDNVSNATGVLVSSGDARRVIDAMVALAVSPHVRVALGRNASSDARARFDQRQQIACYLQWYGAIIESWKPYAV